jgi:hypothetical protein
LLVKLAAIVEQTNANDAEVVNREAVAWPRIERRLRKAVLCGG